MADDRQPVLYWTDADETGRTPMSIPEVAEGKAGG